MSEITLPLAATSAEHAPKSSVQNMSQKEVEKKEVLQNAEKKLVLWFLHSVNHTGSPQDESYIHSLYQGKTVSHLNTSLKKKQQPTILVTAQQAANIIGISIYISLIYKQESNNQINLYYSSKYKALRKISFDTWAQEGTFKITINIT